MESFFSRYRNEWVLLGILFVQLIALATQVRVPNQPRGTTTQASIGPGTEQTGSTRLIRVWAVAAISPFQKLAAFSGGGVRSLWKNYLDLRNVRAENDDLRKQLEQERLAKIRLQQDAEQGRRLQSLLGFKEQFISKTIAAQVIGTSGTELARVVYIDRGARDGIQPGMAVITPGGVVGKIARADRSTSQVLLISDPQSGAGVLLERLRLNGILKGTSSGYPEVQNVMADEKIEVGDRIITTGGDRVFPKGLAVGTVMSSSPDRERDPFLNIRVKPAVDLGRLEEVLIVTEMAERQPEASPNAAVRASDVLAERLPSIKKKSDEEKQQENAIAARSQGESESVPGGVDTAARIEPAAKPRPPSAPTANGGQPPTTANQSPQKPAKENPEKDRPR